MKALNKKVSEIIESQKYKQDEVAEDWAEEDIKYAIEYKITDGKWLKRPITRQEAFVLVVRGIKHVKALLKL